MLYIVPLGTDSKSGKTHPQQPQPSASDDMEQNGDTDQQDQNGDAKQLDQSGDADQHGAVGGEDEPKEKKLSRKEQKKLKKKVCSKNHSHRQ